MPTVRLRDESEYPQGVRKLFELSKEWFGHDFKQPPAEFALLQQFRPPFRRQRRALCFRQQDLFDNRPEFIAPPPKRIGVSVMSLAALWRWMNRSMM